MKMMKSLLLGAAIALIAAAGAQASTCIKIGGWANCYDAGLFQTSGTRRVMESANTAVAPDSGTDGFVLNVSEVSIDAKDAVFDSMTRRGNYSAPLAESRTFRGNARSNY